MGGKTKLEKILLAVFAAGVFFVLCAFASPRFPEGTKVDGTDVSGLSFCAAEKAVRAKLRSELAAKQLKIVVDGKKYTFRYPEINVRTNLSEVLAAAKKGGEHALEKRYYLLRRQKVLSGIADDFYRKSENASMIFDPAAAEPFVFTAEKSGRFLDGRALERAVDEALGGDFKEIRMRSQLVPARVDLQQVKDGVTLLSRFTTRFNASVAGRSKNIALAGSKINGTVLAEGETFSFNQTVGERTRENGFCEAPIIIEGDFQAGVGGGVCQASTTVYNAALLSGMQIVEYHPHSLSVGYVEPSFDAMVSGRNCDLRFTNVTGRPVYILCAVKNGAITVSVYGRKTSVTYRRESVTTQILTPPEPEYASGENVKLRRPKDGLKSEGYLVRLRAGVPVERKLLRRDKYAPVRGILLPPQAEGETGNNADGEELPSTGAHSG